MPVFTPLAAQLLSDHLKRLSDDNLSEEEWNLAWMIIVCIILAIAVLIGLVIVLVVGVVMLSMMTGRAF